MKPLFQIIPAMALALLAGCGPSKPTDTVESLTANPERIKELRKLCREEREKVSDAICLRVAEAAKRRFMGERPEQQK